MYRPVAPPTSVQHPPGISVPFKPTRDSVRRRWGSVMWRSWARVIRGRLPAIGRQDGAILRHVPPPA